MYLCFQLITTEGTLRSRFQAVGYSVTVEVKLLHVLLISVDADFRKQVRYYEILRNVSEIQSAMQSAQLCLCHTHL